MGWRRGEAASSTLGGAEAGAPREVILGGDVAGCRAAAAYVAWEGRMTTGGDKGYVQKRKPRAHEWTKAKRARFLDVLAATCNVEEAARSVKMTARSARGVRRRDGEFAILWAEAFALGEDRLREELVGVLLGQVSSGNNPSAERTPVAPGSFDQALAIKVLQLRARGAPSLRARGSTLPTQDDVDAALLARFETLDKRKAAAIATHGGGQDPV
jgi:hypothetical protein